MVLVPRQLSGRPALPASRQGAAIERVAQRYARTLELTAKDLMTAMQASARSERVPAPEPAEPAKTATS